MYLFANDSTTLRGLQRLAALLMFASVSNMAIAQEAPAPQKPSSPANAAVSAQEQWRKKEVELGKAIDVEFKRVRKEVNDIDEDILKAARERVEAWLFLRSRRASDESEWPLLQLEWAEGAKHAIDKDKRLQDDNELDADIVIGKKVIWRLVDSIRATAVEMKKLNETIEPEVDESDGHAWRFRGLRGQRSTKPQYKGQEPVN